MVPGSLTYDDTGATPVLEVQIYHFSGIQAGLFSGFPFIGIDDVEAGGGCFIDTVSDGPSIFSFQKSMGYMSLLLALALLSLAVCVSAWRRGQSAPG